MFKAPREYVSTCIIPQECRNDLQLKQIYDDLFQEESSTNIRNIWLSKFTTNTDFLKETQSLLKIDLTSHVFNVPFIEIKDMLNEMKSNPSFREKYEYITVDFFESMNKNEHVLQLISMYTLTSPILALLTPFIMIFIPFFILKISNKQITLMNYIQELKHVFSMMPIGKLFQFGSASWDQRGFILFSVILYFVQMYQNTLTCYKFYKNSYKIVNEIHKFGYYCNQTASSMENFNALCEDFKTYYPFRENINVISGKLRVMGSKFLAIKKSILKNMGLKMKTYYDLYCDKEYDNIFNYTFSFHEYIKNINFLSNIDTLNLCKFSKKCYNFKDSYHPILRYQNPVKNSFSLSKTNMILSGPNASGKTTLIKSMLINTILSQQIGKGFYKTANIIPQDYLHCYINIPDTCDRDSLFQAEARRCKHILDSIEKNPNAKHLCVFDELFSGTNPYEAVAAATGYLNYLNKSKNVKYMITTHYVDLCKKFKKQNYTFENKYHLTKGITQIKGGIKVLAELEFPESILKTAKEIVSLN